MKSFESHLKSALEKPLPGVQAQMVMMPRIGGSLDRFSNEARKGAREGAVLLLLYQKNGNIYFPLTQRQEYEGAHSGQISFPGGKKEPEDDSLVHTALRETEEELGVQQSSVRVLGNLTDLFIIASNFNVRPVVGLLSDIPKYTIDDREVAEVLEISIDQLMDTQLVREKEMVFKNNYRLIAPYFDFGGHHVWGATAMMLAEFKHIISDFRI